MTQCGTAFLVSKATHVTTGAVGVLNPGRIWLARNLEEPQRARLACNFAGLMLYLPPTD